MNVDDVKAAHDDMAGTRQAAMDAAERLHVAVAQALADGVRAVDIAEACGVTRGRVYQWANKADDSAR